MRRISSGLMVVMLVTSVLALVANIQLDKGECISCTVNANGESPKLSAQMFSNPPQTQWNQTCGGFSSDSASSVQQIVGEYIDGYIVAGHTDSFGAGGLDFWLVRTDLDGNMMWSRSYGGAQNDVACSVQQTADLGYIVAGYTNSFGAGGTDFWLVRTDSGGNMMWNKTYGGTSGDVAWSLQLTSDGGYIVAGYTNSFGAGGPDFWLVKTDASGNHQWNKTYGGTSSDVAQSLQLTSDGGYIVAGYTNSFGVAGDDLFLVKTDATGNMIWSRTYGGVSSDVACSVQQTADLGYIVAGYTNSFGAGSYDFWLVKTDAGGSMIWRETYGGTSDDMAQSVQQTADLGYIVAGYTNSFGAGSYDFWLVKTDASGNHQWNKTYGGTSSDVAWSLQLTSDGGYIVAGHTSSFGAGSADFWLIKTAPDGPPIPDFSITASPTSLTVQQGSSDTSIITITSIGGFNQPVQLTVSGAPSGVTATPVPDQVTPPPDGSTSSTLIVAVDAAATPENYTLTVTGTNGTLTHSTNLTLKITVPSSSPSITDVTAFYTLDSFFLGNMNGLVPLNQYFVKGDNIERVEFSIYINGTEQVYTDMSPNGEGWYSSAEYDMADVTSNLTITAYNEAEVWVQETVETNVFETPFWLREVITLALENENIEITTDPGSGFGNVWRLSATFQWPEDPFEGEVDLSSLPLIGGKYGVSAGFGFGLSLASDKTVTAEGSGKFKVTIADYEAGADIDAEATIKIGDSIELEDFVINVHGNIKIPIKQKYKWDVWRFSIGVEVGIDFEADASFSFHIEEATSDGTFCDGFDWVTTANDIRFTMHPYAAASVVIGELRVEGEGTVTFTVHVPEPYFTYPDDLKVEATVKLILKTFLHSWEWTVLKYSSGSPVEWTVNASGHGWINRTWATGNYAQYVWMENTTAGNYLENVYLYANPSVASSSDTVMMVWTHDDLSKPYIQGYEVYYSLWNPETEVWSLPSPVTNNTIPEDAVSVKFDAWGNAVAVWSQINNPSLSESVDPFSLFNQTELAYAVWNHTTGLWSEPVLITNNYAYDYSPLLISDQDGNLMVTWLVDQDCNFSTFNDLCIYSSTWNGEQWSSPAFVANPGLISSPIQAAYHNGEAVVVWSEHTDGNTTTLNDTELFYCQFSNYSWSSPIQLTVNNLEDAEPSIAFRYNHPVFAWIQRNETDSLMFFDPENGSPRSVLERLGVSSPLLSVDKQNRTLIVWADPAYQTPFSFSLTPDGYITFVELLEQSSQRNIYCKTCQYQNVIMDMSNDNPIHVIDLDAQLSVFNVTSLKTVVTEGRCDQINITINNQGYFTHPLNVTLYANSTAIYGCSATLQGDSSTIITFTWNTTGWAKGNYTISVYVAPVPGETDLSDNNFTDGWVFVTIQGDVDGDRDVDIYDVVKITGIYHSKRGDPQFNPNSDLDNDGEIKIYDVVMCTSHYGQSW